MRSLLWLLAPLPILTALSCGGGELTLPPQGDGIGEGGEAVVPSPALTTVTAAPTVIPVVMGVSEITVTVRDETGARVPGATVLLTASGTGTTITQPAGPTNVDGVATGRLSSTQPGAKQVTAVVNGATQIYQVAQVMVAGAVHHLEFLVQPHDVREDEPFTVQVALVDLDGNVVPLSGIEIYVDLFRAGKRHPDNTRALGDRFRATVDGIAVFDLRVVNGSSGGPVGRSESGYRLRALTDELPELGPHGPTPFLFSRPFDVN